MKKNRRRETNSRNQDCVPVKGINYNVISDELRGVIPGFMLLALLGCEANKGSELNNTDISGVSEVIDQSKRGVQEAISNASLRLSSDIEPISLSLAPEFTFSGESVGVIINGDIFENRHFDNVELAYESLKLRGIQRFYIMSQNKVGASSEVTMYEPSISGFEKMYKDLGEIRHNSFVFTYVTGHGNKGLIALSNDKEGISHEKFAKKYEDFGKKKHVNLFLFDQCYGGDLPEKVITYNTIGEAYAVGVNGVETMCQNFTPHFFHNVKTSYDPNNDGNATIQEAFQFSMLNYSALSKKHEYGVVFRSIPELQAEDIERHSSKNLLVVIGATWCGVCKKITKKLSSAYGMYGSDLEIKYLTADVNPNKEVLLDKLGIDIPSSYPLLLVRRAGLKKFESFDYISKETVITELSEKLRLKFDTAHLKKILIQNTDLEENVIDKYLEAKIFNLEVYKSLPKSFRRFEVLKKSYPEDLSNEQVAFLIFNKISPSDYVNYPSRFNKEEKFVFAKYRVSYRKVRQYNKRFDAYEIVDLYKAGVKNKYAVKFDERFNGNDISALVGKYKVKPNVANKYDNRFSGVDVRFLVSKKITSDTANNYDKRFSDFYITLFHEKSFTSEQVNGFDSRFGYIDIVSLLEGNVSYEVANRYDKRFNGNDIARLVKKNISPEIANSYDKRFSDFNIAQLVDNNIKSDVINKCPSRFKGSECMVLFEGMVLFESNLDFDVVLKYDKKFDSVIIFEMLKYNLYPAEANNYTYDQVKKIIRDKSYKQNKKY